MAFSELIQAFGPTTAIVLFGLGAAFYGFPKILAEIREFKRLKLERDQQEFEALKHVEASLRAELERMAAKAEALQTKANLLRDSAERMRAFNEAVKEGDLERASALKPEMERYEAMVERMYYREFMEGSNKPVED